MGVGTLRNRARFSKTINLRGHKTKFSLKYERFSFYLHWNHCINGYWNSSEQGSFFHEMIDLRGPMPRFTLKNECFPIYLLGNPINVSWNHQNRACFSKTIDLRGHMPRFTLKSECFPICLLSNMPEMGVVTLRTGFVFWRWSIWSVTCLGWPEKWMFSHLSPWNYPRNVCWNPSGQGSFLQDDQFGGVICLGLL